MKQQIKNLLTVAASRCGPHRIAGSAPRLWVLMYHRILPPSDPRFAQEEPGMIVTPGTFRQQLRQIKQLFEPMHLSEWIERRNAGKALPKRACAVTFDDGWLDNFEFAFPILQQEQVPATVFAVADMIGTNRQFWPNRLARVLASTEPGSTLTWLNPLGYDRQRQSGREAVAQLIHQCKAMSDETLLTLLDEAETKLGLPVAPAPVLMNWEQLRTMQQSGLVEIGSHTCNHLRLLPTLPESVLSQEIIASKRKLEDALDRPVTSFCYPNGDVSPAGAALVQKYYRVAVTTERGINRMKTQSHNLLRVGVHEDVSNTPSQFEARLSGWL